MSPTFGIELIVLAIVIIVGIIITDRALSRHSGKNSMSSKLGIALLVLGILMIVGTVSGWLYLANYCSPGQIGFESSSYPRSTCFGFYTSSQINQGGLASVNMPFVFNLVLVLGFILVIGGLVLLIVRRSKSQPTQPENPPAK